MNDCRSLDPLERSVDPIDGEVRSLLDKRLHERLVELDDIRAGRLTPLVIRW